MAVIERPNAFRVKNIEWRLDRPAQVNRSTYTGARRVVTQPGHARWSATVTLAPIVGQGNVLTMRAFLAKLRGQINTFRLPAVEADQFSPPTTSTVLSDRAAGVTSFTIVGPIGAPQLVAGTTIGILGYLYTLTVDTTAGGGADQRVITITPGLVESVPNGTPVYIDAVGVNSDRSAGISAMTVRSTPGQRQFLAGEMLTIGEQLVTLTEASTTAGGTDLRVIQFEPPLREAILNNTVIEHVEPWALVALTGSEAGWSVAPGQIYAMQLEVEEAF